MERSRGRRRSVDRLGDGDVEDAVDPLGGDAVFWEKGNGTVG